MRLSYHGQLSFFEALNPRLSDAAPRATPITIPSNRLSVISPVNAPENVAIAPGIKYYLVISHLIATRVVVALIWSLSLTTSERSLLVLSHILYMEFDLRRVDWHSLNILPRPIYLSQARFIAVQYMGCPYRL
jgi:hypothetical protein